jgi:hypothetical protein
MGTKNWNKIAGLLDGGTSREARIMEFFLVPTLVFGLIAVHKTGHYIAGLTAGIPATAMRIRLLTFPQHVALWDGGRWVSPVNDIEHFIEVSRRYLSTRTAAFRWVAGGLVAETGFTTIVCILAMQLGWRSVAFWTAVISLAVYLINVLLMDIPWALIRRHAFGDTSGLWEISRLPALVVTALMLAIRLLLVWYVRR